MLRIAAGAAPGVCLVALSPAMFKLQAAERENEEEKVTRIKPCQVCLGHMCYFKMKQYFIGNPLYCRVPARWGLQQTHPGLRAATRHGVRDPLVRSQVDYTC